MVTSEVGLIGGREPYGFPKLYGNVEWLRIRSGSWRVHGSGDPICGGTIVA